MCWSRGVRCVGEHFLKEFSEKSWLKLWEIIRSSEWERNSECSMKSRRWSGEKRISRSTRPKTKWEIVEEKSFLVGAGVMRSLFNCCDRRSRAGMTNFRAEIRHSGCVGVKFSVFIHLSVCDCVGSAKKKLLLSCNSLTGYFPAVILSNFIPSRCKKRVSGREDETIVINLNGS